MTNRSNYRVEFGEVLHDVGPLIYVIFFTITGAALALDIFLATWPIAVILFVVRLVGIISGSLVGGIVACDPMRRNRLLWMAFVTQAGVALGLAREVAAEFPMFGDAFATMVISVVVINESVGPILFKSAIRRTGEAHTPAHAEPDAVRDVLILGAGSQALALARQLLVHQWQVIMADVDAERIAWIEEPRIQVNVLPDISRKSLAEVVTPSMDALVVMMADDDLNMRACELIYEHFGVPRMVALLNDYATADRFAELGVRVVYPASALVHLLDHFVRTPQTAALLMQEDAANEIVQITITNPDIDNLRLRDLRLPGDVIVLGIMRDGSSILPHGHTILKLRDEVTLIGIRQQLDEVTLRLGF